MFFSTVSRDFLNTFFFFFFFFLIFADESEIFRWRRERRLEIS